MNTRISRLTAASPALLLLVASACAVRLGGASPEPRTTAAIEVAPGATTAAVAERIRADGARVVLLSAPPATDSAWFAEVARQAGLVSTSPGRTSTASFAFLTEKAPVGDTLVSLAVDGADSLRVHDALFRIDKQRNLDLMIFRVEPNTPSRAAMQALLQYVSTDVANEAAVAVAVDVPNGAKGDTIVALLTPLFAGARECERPADAAALSGAGIRLLYGPEMRMSCDWSRVPRSDEILARLVIRR